MDSFDYVVIFTYFFIVDLSTTLANETVNFSKNLSTKKKTPSPRKTLKKKNWIQAKDKFGDEVVEYFDFFKFNNRHCLFF